MIHEPDRADFTQLSQRLLAVSGPLTEPDLPLLRWRLSCLVQANSFTTVNLTRVTYLPAAAMGVLARARLCARQRSRRLDVRARCDSEAARLLSLTGMPFDRTPIDAEVRLAPVVTSPTTGRDHDGRRVLSP